jgi:hypothetical protein
MKYCSNFTMNKSVIHFLKIFFWGILFFSYLIKSVIQVRECIIMGRICLQYTNALNKFFYYMNKISAMGAEIIMYTAPSSAEVLCKF